MRFHSHSYLVGLKLLESATGQKYRARTGLTPDQAQLSSGNATRFLDYDDMYDAMKRAASEYAQNPRPYFELDMSDLGRNVGKGYYQGGRAADYATTTRVAVQYDSAGELVSIYPKLP